VATPKQLRFKQFEVVKDREHQPVAIIALDLYGRMWTTRYNVSYGPEGALPWTFVASLEVEPADPLHIESPQFVSFTHVPTGNFLLGIKDDGSTWRCDTPNANPLVWIEV
jgi:hypothetical protein